MSDKTSAEGALVAVSEAAPRSRGFTQSGARKYQETVVDYAAQLLERASHLGDADKAPNMPAEVTHEHVRAAAHSMARSFGSPPRPKWLVATNVGEYMATAVAGVGGGHLDKPAGILAFALGLSVAVLLVVIRLTQSRAD